MLSQKPYWPSHLLHDSRASLKNVGLRSPRKEQSMAPEFSPFSKNLEFSHRSRSSKCLVKTVDLGSLLHLNVSQEFRYETQLSAVRCAHCDSDVCWVLASWDGKTAG